MLAKTITNQFQSKKIQQNALCRFASSINDEDYIQPQPTQSTNSHQLHSRASAGLDGKEEVLNLQDLWNQLMAEGQEQHSEKSRIVISVMDVQAAKAEREEIIEFTEEEFAQLIGEAPQSDNQTQKKAQLDEVEDLSQLWQQISQEQTQNNQSITTPPPKNLQKEINPSSSSSKIAEAPLTPPPQVACKPDSFNLSALLSQKSERSLNCNLSRDYLVYDYQNFVLSCFQTNIHSYFGFSQSKQASDIFYFYDLTTKEPIIECSLDSYDQTFKSQAKKVKVDYEIQYCLKFRLVKTGQLIACAFHKYINNGILYNIKPFNSYENQYEDSLALIEITDGFIGNNCYCNTNVYISQKYTNQPGQLKMIIGVKNGFLIANMGVNGIKSAPYNCRLQNYQSNFVYLLGLIDKEKSEFVVRVGEGMSPLIAFAISIGRKRYIDSFSE